MRYLLSICILFLGGLLPLTAHSGVDVNHSSRESHPELSTFDTVEGNGNEELAAFTIFSSGSEKKKQNNFVEVAEVKAEEDEVHVSKKYFQGNGGYTASFDTQSAVYFLHYLKHRTSMCRQLSYQSASASLTVAYGVFRL